MKHANWVEVVNTLIGCSQQLAGVILAVVSEEYSDVELKMTSLIMNLQGVADYVKRQEGHTYELPDDKALQQWQREHQRQETLAVSVKDVGKQEQPSEVER